MSEKALVAEVAREVMEVKSFARGLKEADILLVAEDAKDEKRDIPQGDAATVVSGLDFSFSFLTSSGLLRGVGNSGFGSGSFFAVPEISSSSRSMSSQNLFRSPSRSSSSKEFSIILHFFTAPHSNHTLTVTLTDTETQTLSRWGNSLPFLGLSCLPATLGIF